MRISLQNLSKQYKAERMIHAVEQVSLEVESGRFLAIIGRSGSGKSTLLGMLGGLSAPSSGSVILNETNLFSLKANALCDFRNRNIGFVFQFASLLPSLRAIDNVALPALIGKTLDEKDAYARARSLLQHVGLSDRISFYPAQLSGGEQRRVAIARALINAPSLLAADEPTADLDEATEKEILDLLVDIHRSFGLTLVVVTHNQEIAKKADQIVEMRSGAAVETKVSVSLEPVLVETATPVRSAGAVKTYPESESRDTTWQLPGESRKRFDDLRVDGYPEQDENSITSHRAAAQTIDFTWDPSRNSRVQEIFEISKQKAAAEQVKLGAGFERMVGRCALWMIPVFALCWSVNAAVAAWENSVLNARVEQRLALEELAMSGLRADVKEITFGPGKSYRLSIYLRNTTNGQPIYVMSPAVRAFVQVGSGWQEFSLKPVESGTPQVVKITGERIFNYNLEPDAANFAELIPFYMHVRISNDMIVSPRSEPKDDLIDRTDNYYVYLKPHEAVDSEIQKKLKFPQTPPVWIPMPPH